MRSLLRPCLLLAAALITGASLSAGEIKAQTLNSGDVLISEFRLSGPGGDSDEYIELYCNRDAPCDVSGYVIRGFDPSFGDFNVTLPASSFIPTREHLLIADLSQYTLNAYSFVDVDINSGFDVFIDNEGFQLRTPDESAVIDSVGFAGSGGRPNESTNYVEGTGLERATAARPADQYAYVRKMGTATGGRPQDTDNNANDFVLVSVTAAAHPGITRPVVLGAPGPQSSGGPRTFDNSLITASLVEPNASASAAPNRVFTVGGDGRQKLSIRRTFTNNLNNETINYLAFRVIDITTTGSPQTFARQAQLRLVTSGDAETFTNSRGRTVVIHGTLLEFDPGHNAEPAQPNGGGLNTSAIVNFDVNNPGIAPGESVDVQFLLDVVQGGSYRFYVNVEAISGDTPPPLAPALTPITGGSTAERVGGVRPSSNTSSPTRKAVVAKSRTPSAPKTQPVATRGVLTVTTPTAPAPTRKR
jgi:hypothetical protein